MPLPSTKPAFMRAMEEAIDWSSCTRAAVGGPILDLYSVPFHKLANIVDSQITDLMLAIARSTAPYDRSPDPQSIGSDVLGAMRQTHSNNPRYLPPIDASMKKTSRGAVYESYTRTNKGQSNDNGGSSTPTGYVEYTAGTLALNGWGGNRFRIVFDYYRGVLYFTPLHYASWELAGGDIKTIDKPPRGSGHWNPFFRIADIVPAATGSSS